MVLGTVSALRETIDEFLQSMYELAKKKGISDPRVIKISQQLDGKIMMLQNIMMLQKIIYHSQSLSTAKTLYYDENMIEPVNITHSK
ncbi:aspartyl-phosphate phosphatase Spo0E family protein [Priestia megaterium]|uniref:Aspartyl-phosphate phosphatase Spo0E family protein n=1 Tax=Priestia megaterium TaxID=1404 RepID=A0A6H1NZL6_PRIMG|nr:aspartyl-phosphate phosphatase Spo0E family protein [Priestia megaterium]QIZ06665.1 aspartyl-phosphate phosphatase Spo0E family protein [Priestia megaterium]